MRKILHVDLDAFFCSVEELLDPSLTGKPFATGGTSDGRGVVTSCSYAARKFGIHSAMPMKQALRLCPDLITVRGKHRKYGEYSKNVKSIFDDITPLVESISIDEAFLDVTDIQRPIKDTAILVQMRVKRETGLPCSIGAAANKLVAKIANNIGKSSHSAPTAPMAITVIPAGEEAKFLSTLPIREMWGIGPKSAEHFKENGILTIGDIQEMPLEKLQQISGNFASVLKRRALGIDDRPVGDYEGVKSVSNERTFFDFLKYENEVTRVVKSLSEKVGHRLRQKGLCGKTVRLKIRWANFNTITRQITLDQPTNHDSVIFDSAMDLLMQNWKPGKEIRLIGVGVASLDNAIQQLSLFDNRFKKEQQLLTAMDDLKERFGSGVIQKGEDYRKGINDNRR